MSLISYNGLVKLVENGVINAPLENINGSSIDITLDDTFLREDIVGRGNVKLYDKNTIHSTEIICDEYYLQPGEFILASSKEIFNLPNNISAEYKLKSSLARSGLQHLLAGWCDPGWNNSKLTLELKNITRYHTLTLKPGMKIGQMVFWKCDTVPNKINYKNRDQYNNQSRVTPSKGIR